jgi:hypothetical protein
MLDFGMNANLVPAFHLAALFAVTLVGCQTTSDPIKEANKPLRQVQMFTTNKNPPGAYQLVARIKSVACSTNSSPAMATEEALALLSVYAAKHGGDAVIHIACEEKGAGVKNNCTGAVVCSADAVHLVE